MSKELLPPATREVVRAEDTDTPSHKLGGRHPAPDHPALLDAASLPGSSAGSPVSAAGVTEQPTRSGWSARLLTPGLKQAGYPARPHNTTGTERHLPWLPLRVQEEGRVLRVVLLQKGTARPRTAASRAVSSAKGQHLRLRAPASQERVHTGWAEAGHRATPTMARRKSHAGPEVSYKFLVQRTNDHHNSPS